MGPPAGIIDTLCLLHQGAGKVAWQSEIEFNPATDDTRG